MDYLGLISWAFDQVLGGTTDREVAAHRFDKGGSGAFDLSVRILAGQSEQSGSGVLIHTDTVPASSVADNGIDLLSR